MQPTTVLLVNWAGTYGGAEQYQLNLVRGFDQTRYRFLFASPGGEWPNRLIAAGYRHFEVPLRPGFDPESVLRLRRIIKQERVDIVHAQQSRALLQAGLAATLVGGVAVVQTEHNMSLGWHRGGVYPWFVNWINHPVRRLVVHFLADRIIALGQSGKEFYTRIVHTAPAKIVIIPSPFPVHPEHAAPDNPDPTIGIPAELTERKGLIYLIAAAPLVLQKYPRAQFLIAGKGHLEEELKHQVADAHLGDNVHFLGFVPNVATQMPGWDMLVLPSLWDPFPQAILEAMAHGRPVVTTAVDGALEMVVDGETGLLVPPGDAPALAGAILRLLDDRDLAQRMGRLGRQRVADLYDLARIVRELDMLYQAVLTEAR
jgi:glycosyltransferase involved in cell wall biosynthesis